MEIAVYGTPACGVCKQVVSFLSEENIEHDYKTIGKDIDLEDVEKIIGRLARTVPIIVADGNELTFDTLREKVNSENSLGSLEL